MFRRCCGCKKRRGSVPAAGAGWICDGCARSFGMFGSKLPNIAEKNSKHYRDTQLCKNGKHNDVHVSRYRKGGKQYEKGTCKRCGTVVYDAVFA